MDQPPPLPVLPLEYAPPALQRRPWLLIVTSWLSLLTLVVGTAAMYWETKSVLVSGAALTVLGAVMLIGGLATMQKRLWIPGAANLGICTLFVALVNGLGWGPSEAAMPFAAMSTVYTAAMAVVFIKLLRDQRRQAV